MAITPLPPAPTRADPVNFWTRGDALLTALVNLFVPEANALQADVAAKQVSAAASASAAQADRVLAAAAAAAVALQSPSANAAAAQAAAADAQAFASIAQATTPDTPMRQTQREIGTSFTLASAYNANSTGPITVSDGVTVTISNNSTWSIT